MEDYTNKGLFMRILVVTSSFSNASHSTSLARLAANAIAGAYPKASIETLDVAANPPGLFDANLASAVFAGSTEHAALKAKAESDAYIAQLQGADALVLAVPMFNFGVPAVLKSWMDQVARAGVTFEYTATGANGLVKIPALIVASSGGVYKDTPWEANNHADTHAAAFLSFLGMAVQTVALEGTASKKGEELVESVAQAENGIRDIVQGWKLV